MKNISIERLQEIENERQETVIDKSFQEWVSSLGVSRYYIHPEPRLRARVMTQQYDFSKNKVAGMEKISYL